MHSNPSNYGYFNSSFEISIVTLHWAPEINLSGKFSIWLHNSHPWLLRKSSPGRRPNQVRRNPQPIRQPKAPKAIRELKEMLGDLATAETITMDRGYEGGTKGSQIRRPLPVGVLDPDD